MKSNTIGSSLFCCSLILLSSYLLAGCGLSAGKNSEKISDPAPSGAAAKNTVSESVVEPNYPAVSAAEKTEIDNLIIEISNIPAADGARDTPKARLAKYGSAAIPSLVEHLTDPSQTVRRESNRLLKDYGIQAIPALVAYFDTDYPNEITSTKGAQQDAAARALASIGDDVVARLLPYIKSKNANHRASGCRAFMLLSYKNFYLDESVSTEIAHLLATEQSADVRKACVSVTSSQMFARKDLRLQFEKTLRSDEDPAVRIAAIAGLNRLAQDRFGQGPGFELSFQADQLPEVEKAKIWAQVQSAQMEIWKHVKMKPSSSSSTSETDFEFDEKFLKDMPYMKYLEKDEKATDISLLIARHLSATSLKGKLIETGFPSRRQNEVIQLLATVFRNDSNIDVSTKAKDLLMMLAGQKSGEAALIALLPLLEDDRVAYDEKIRILRMITPGVGKDGVDGIAKALSQYDLRNDALAALRTIGDAARPAALAVRELSSNPLFRDQCVITLVSIGSANDEDRAHLERLLDKGGVKGANCALTLASSNPVACKPYLQRIEKLLDSSDIQVRDLAARALKNMGVEGEPALASLKAAAQRYSGANSFELTNAASEIESRLERKWNEMPRYMARGKMMGAMMVGRIVNQGDVVAPSLGSKSGYIDKTGTLVITNKNRLLRPFSEGVARLTDFKFDEKSHIESFIDTKGKTILSLPGLTAESFHEGRAVVRKPDDKSGFLCGFVDKTGKTVIPFKFADACDFSEGRAAVIVAGSKPNKVGLNQFASKGFIDVKGKVVIEPQFSTAENFSEGLALVRDFDSHSYFIDTNGQRADFQINEGEPVKGFSEGLAVVRIRGKYGYIDKSGKIVIPAIYDDAGSFKDGLASVASGAEQGYGFIDKQGNTVVPFRYDWAHHFSDGLALVKKDGLYGYIDKSGVEVLKPQFVTANDFQDGLAPVGTGFVELLD